MIFRKFRGLIRSEGQRALAPAVLVIAQERMAKDLRSRVRILSGIVWRCYRDVAMLRCTPEGDLVLPLRGHKYDEVHTELAAAARDVGQAASIAHAPRRGRRFDAVALVILLRTLPLIWRTHSRPRLRPYCDVLSHAHAFSLALAREPKSRYWLIIGDLSPLLIALAGACRVAGHRVIYWQYSYLDFKHMPVAADIAVILNDAGRDLAVPPASPKPRSVFWRPREEVSQLRLDEIATGPIGAILNVHADKRALRQLEVFAERLERPLEVRLHPNSKLGIEDWSESLTRAPEDEPLCVFAQRHTLILGGNTQAQTKALVCGASLVHCSGLDPLQFDHHDYVRAGILPGWESPDDVDLAGLRKFFQGNGYIKALHEHLGPEPQNRVPPLSALMQKLTKLPT